jgi:hypothetical protein
VPVSHKRDITRFDYFHRNIYKALCLHLRLYCGIANYGYGVISILLISPPKISFTQTYFVARILHISLQTYFRITLCQNIKFGKKFIIALCNVFKKIARTRRFYFEKWHPVSSNLFKYRHWFLCNDVISNFFK